MDLLNTMVECVIPRVSASSGRVVRALVTSRGTFGDAQVFARLAGFRNRDQLRRTLEADGLPSLENLAGWIRVIGWVVDAEDHGLALSRSALRDGKYPVSCYRTVERLTRTTWREVRLRGSVWVLLQFQAEIESRLQRCSQQLSPSSDSAGATSEDALKNAG
jgi:hypothetical protein